MSNYYVETKPVAGEEKYGGGIWHKAHTGYLPRHLAEDLMEKLSKKKKGVLHVRIQQVKEER